MSGTTTNTPATAQTSPEAKEIKAELQIAAATLTAAVIGKMQLSVAPAADPTVKDPNLQNLNLTAAALQKVFYAFLDAAENNAGVDADGTINGWADPIMPTAIGGGSVPGGIPPALLTGLSSGLSTTLQAAGVASTVIQQVQQAIAALAGPAKSTTSTSTPAATANPAPAQSLGS